MEAALSLTKWKRYNIQSLYSYRHLVLKITSAIFTIRMMYAEFYIEG